MCGRTTYKLTWEEIVALYRLTFGQPAVNTRPPQRLSHSDMIVGPDDKCELVRVLKGLLQAATPSPPKLRFARLQERGPNESGR
jgi:hypothetical protein